MHYREALVADIPQLMAVRLAVRENRLSDPARVPYEAYVDYLTRRGQGWVAEDAGHILGFAIADLLGHSVWALFVHPDYEARGLGKTLHDLMLTWYFRQTQHPVWLSTDPGTRAEAFYRRQGWQETGRTESGEVRFRKGNGIIKYKTMKKSDHIELEGILAKISAAGIHCAGSSPAEVQAVEEKLQVQMPLAYKKMLQVYGDESGHFFCGSSVETHVLEWIQAHGREAYVEVFEKPCPLHFFFILEHQGYSYYYLDLTESSENTGVYFLMNADINEHHRVGTLVEFFDKEVERVIEVTIKINNVANINYTQPSISKHQRDKSFIDRIKHWIWVRSLRSKAR